LHPEVEVSISITVARNADEAQRIAHGEDVTAVREETAEAEALAAAERFFEPEAAEAARAREAPAEDGETAEKAEESETEAEKVGKA